MIPLGVIVNPYTVNDLKVTSGNSLPTSQMQPVVSSKIGMRLHSAASFSASMQCD